MITIEGKNGIKATILAHSISRAGKVLVTWEIEYPRLVLAELNTHRQLSRNSFSSRAVPFLKMLEQLNGEPVRFGANQAGMQDKGEDYDAPIYYETDDGDTYQVSTKMAWELAKADAIVRAEGFYDAGYHKQVYNRLLEPFQMMKTVLSATEVDNFFWLRDDDAADPTLRELARVMKEVMDASTPVLLQAGEWHLPYVDCLYENGVQNFYIWPDQAVLDNKPADEATTMGDMVLLTLEEAIKVSCARCAAVSYRNEGYSLEKSIEVYDRLVGSDKKHASAFEHCGTPIEEPVYSTTCGGSCYGMDVDYDWEDGVTHMDRKGRLWSGNFCGFIQYRKLIKGECYEA